MFKKNNLVLLGGPGAGKGTLSALLKENSRLFHISTGDLLRAEIKAGTELGKQAKAIIGAGKLLSDEIVGDLVRNALAQCKKDSGILFDGYPRTVRQAEALDELLKEKERPLDAVIYLYADDDFLLKRLTSRIMCRKCNRIYNRINMAPRVEGVCDSCGGEIYQRDDDSEASALNRLKIFHAETQPLIEFYCAKGLLIKVPCGERDVVLAELLKVLN